MSVENFHKFYLKTKASQIEIFEGETPQGIVSTYASCLEEAISAINTMLAYLASSDPEVVNNFTSRKSEIAADLENDLNSHMRLWKELSTMASDLQSEILQSTQWQEKNVKIAGLEKKTTNLKDKLENDDLSFEDWKKQMTRLQTKTTTQQAKNIFFEKTKKAFKYFQESVKAFAQCGMALLKDAGSDLEWLDDATLLAAKQLSQKSK